MLARNGSWRLDGKDEWACSTIVRMRMSLAIAGVRSTEQSALVDGMSNKQTKRRTKKYPRPGSAERYLHGQNGTQRIADSILVMVKHVRA